MSIAFEQTMILFVFALTGYLLGKTGRLKEEYSGLLSTLEVYVFLPCVSFSTFSTHFNRQMLTTKLPLIASSFVILAILVLISTFMSRRMSRDVMQQNIYCYSLAIPNFGYMGYALAQGLYGDAVLLDAMIFALPLNLYVNAEGFRMLTGAQRRSFKRIMNPMMIMLLLGCVVGYFEWQVPALVSTIVDKSAACMAPISMLLGGIVLSSFPVGKLLHNRHSYLITLLRLLVIPALIALGTRALCSPDVIRVAVLLYAMPCGLNTIVFPKLVNGDCETGASLALISNVLALATVPLFAKVISLIA